MGKKPGDKGTRTMCWLGLGAGVWESAPSPDQILAHFSQLKLGLLSFA